MNSIGAVFIVPIALSVIGLVLFSLKVGTKL